MAASIEVLLTADVPGTGKKGALVSVSAGFAYNSLLPSKKAVIATPEVIAKKQRELFSVQQQEEQHLRALDTLAQSLSHATVRLFVKANEKGILYAKVSAKQLVEAFHTSGYHQVNEKMFVEYSPITKTSETTVVVALGKKRVDVHVHVIA